MQGLPKEMIKSLCQQMSPRELNNFILTSKYNWQICASLLQTKRIMQPLFNQALDVLNLITKFFYGLNGFQDSNVVNLDSLDEDELADLLKLKLVRRIEPDEVAANATAMTQLALRTIFPQQLIYLSPDEEDDLEEEEEDLGSDEMEAIKHNQWYNGYSSDKMGLPALESMDYLVIDDLFEQVHLDAELKAGPITVYDVLMAARALFRDGYREADYFFSQKVNNYQVNLSVVISD